MNRARRFWPSGRRLAQGSEDDVIGELIQTRFLPGEPGGMAIGVNVIGGATVTVETEPALVAVLSNPPSHKRGFSGPGIVIVLVYVPIHIVICSVQRFRIAFGE